jgi:hypothetical protein
MTLLRYSTRRFGLLPAWLGVVVVSPLCCSRRHRHVGSRSSFSWCWDALFLLLVVDSSSILAPRRSSLSSSRSLLLACRGWFGFAVVGLVWLSLVSFRCRWLRFAAVGLDSASLVSSRRGWFPRRLAPSPPCRLALVPLLLLSLPLLVLSLLLVILTLLHFAFFPLPPRRLASSSSPFALFVVVFSSPLRCRVALLPSLIRDVVASLVAGYRCQ